MFRIKNLIIAGLCVIATMVAGCENETPNTENEGGGIPSVVLDRYELNVDGNGGDMDIYYGVTNPIKGEKPEINSRVDWVTVKSIDAKKIIFTIAKNMDREGREALLTLDYKNMEKSVKIVVKQDAAVLDMFKFEVSDVTYKGCKVRYIPYDDNVQYMANIIDKAYFDHSGVDTEEAFIEAEMNNYLAVATTYKLTLEELMSAINPPLIYTGEVTREFMGMQHGGTFVVYSYGVTFSENSYEVTTPVHYTLVELPMPSMYEVSFSLNARWDGSGTVALDVEPQNWDGYYSIQVASDESLYYVEPGEPITEFTRRSLANTFYKNAVSYIKQGFTPERFLDATCYRGSHHEVLQLDGSKRYMIIVFAVESKDGEIPVMRSIPTVAYI